MNVERTTAELGAAGTEGGGAQGAGCQHHRELPAVLGNHTRRLASAQAELLQVGDQRHGQGLEARERNSLIGLGQNLNKNVTDAIKEGVF